MNFFIPKSFEVLSNTTLYTALPTDSYSHVISLKFKGKLPLSQPSSHIKIIHNFRLKTYSLTSIPESNFFEIIVKVYRKGNTSVFLSGLRVGEVVKISKTRFKPILESFNVGIIVFGIAITEVLPVLIPKLLLEGKKVGFVYVVRFQREILFGNLIDSLLRDYSDKFFVRFVFSQEVGRLNKDVLVDLFQKWESEFSQSRFLVVGSGKMRKSSYGMLREMGFNNYLLGKPEYS